MENQYRIIIDTSKVDEQQSAIAGAKKQANIEKATNRLIKYVAVDQIISITKNKHNRT